MSYFRHSPSTSTLMRKIRAFYVEKRKEAEAQDSDKEAKVESESQEESGKIDCDEDQRDEAYPLISSASLYTNSDIECHMLSNGMILYFENARPQRLYLDIKEPSSYANLSLARNVQLLCAGVKGNTIYFYAYHFQKYLFYRACVNDFEGKFSIKFQFIRSDKLTSSYSGLAIQQPYYLKYTGSRGQLWSFEGEPAHFHVTNKFFESSELISTEFFCHRGLVFLIKESSDNDMSYIENTGHVRVIFLEKKYFLDKIPRTGGAQTGPGFSIYAQYDSLIYVKCNNAVLIIGPSLTGLGPQSHLFVQLDTRYHQYIVGLENMQLVTRTVDGLARLHLGKKHEELCQLISSQSERELIMNREEIACMYDYIDKLKKDAQKSKDKHAMLEEELEKIRKEYDLVATESSSIGRSKAPTLPNAVEEYSSKFANEFKTHMILGVGGYGVVFEATNRFDQSTYAVKRVAVPHRKIDLRVVLREVRAMAQLDHPGIVRYNSTWLERPPLEWQHSADSKMLEKMKLQSYRRSILNYKPDSGFIYIQMQLCDSSLCDWLKNNSDPSSRPIAHMKSWIKQIVSAVQYIHDKNMIHRDLKPSNILLVEQDRVKLCDLGIVTDRAIDDKGKEISVIRSNTCTLLYTSPEQESLIPRYSSKTDIFSMGLIFAELCLVMNDGARIEIFDRFRRGVSQEHLFDDAGVAKFVAWLTNSESKNRPLCCEILQNSFLQ